MARVDAAGIGAKAHLQINVLSDDSVEQLCHAAKDCIDFCKLLIFFLFEGPVSMSGQWDVAKSIAGWRQEYFLACRFDKPRPPPPRS